MYVLRIYHIYLTAFFLLVFSQTIGNLPESHRFINRETNKNVVIIDQCLCYQLLRKYLRN